MICENSEIMKTIDKNPRLMKESTLEGKNRFITTGVLYFFEVLMNDRQFEELKSLLNDLIAITFTEALSREMAYQRQRDQKEPDEESVAVDLLLRLDNTLNLYKKVKQDLPKPRIL